MEGMATKGASSAAPPARCTITRTGASRSIAASACTVAGTLKVGWLGRLRRGRVGWSGVAVAQEEPVPQELSSGCHCTLP